MEKKTKFTIIYFLIALTVIIVLENYLLSKEITTITYSEFKTLIKDGLINDLVITQTAIEGKFVKGARERLETLRKGKDQTIQPLKETQIFYVVRMDDPDLVKELTEKGITFTAKQEITWFKTLLSWILPMLIFIAIWGYLLKKIGSPGGGGFMAVGKSKAKVYVEGETKITFEDVAGVDEAEEELKEVIEFLKNPQKFQSLGGKIPKGILLVGPPGTGKTLLARAVAGEAKVAFLSISGSDFVEMFVGVGAARVRDLFAQAEKLAPCIIFIDEIDAMGKSRGINPVGGVDEKEQTLTQLLTEMDGFDTKKGVIIMAATNRPEILDQALLRPGRFDRHILVDRPDIKGREEIFKVHTKKVKLGNDVDLKVLASMTPGMVGADIANIVNEAALLAVRKNKDVIEMEDFEEAIERVIAGLEKKSRVINKQERERVAYHESGHAIVASVLPNADPVRRVSIIPRGIAALGYTIQLPTEDRYLLTKSELLDRMAVMLGGKAAEEIIFGEASTGAKNDLDKATEMATSMVRAYGMSDKLGPVSFDKGRPLFLETPWNQQKDYSEFTAREIDEEVKRILIESYQKARQILSERIEKLKQIASVLLEKEVLEGEELKRLIEIGN
ncbi:MAG: ATP-dependent metallopeptidase FtsH/Yme1/Tma family protein [Nitrospirae bacterium]|jgi:cell division protease FtsH|nr:ATP-dependent metallopeptidase FtsH/Yme1/Tma family protein [Nitrospirota bacterium]